MAKQKPIPWINTLRKIARYIETAQKSGNFLREGKLSRQFHANVKRLLLAADFEGVRWQVAYFQEAGGRYRPWIMRIRAKFTKANMTRWMKAIKEARALGGKRWRRAMTLSPYDDYTATKAAVDTGYIEIEFRLKDRAKTFCKKHRIRLVSARSRLDAINEQLSALVKEKTALKTALEDMTRKYR